MAIKLGQERAATRKTERGGNPAQIAVLGRQDVGLLVIEVLDAVFDPAQEDIGFGQRLRRGLRHQTGARQPLQSVQGWTGSQFGELAAAHHLQQLHGELDFPDTATGQLDVICALGVAGAAPRGVVANLPVQGAQRFEHVVVQVPAKHERQHDGAE